MKYEITDESKDVNISQQNSAGIADSTSVGKTKVFRIRALVDIPRHGIKAGDIGGWVENELNLSQVNDAWVAGEAAVFANGHVSKNALVKDRAVVRDGGWVTDNAVVFGDALVYRHGIVCGEAKVRGIVSNEGKVCGAAEVGGVGFVEDHAVVGGHAVLIAGSVRGEGAYLGGTAKVSINGPALRDGNIVLSGDVWRSTDLLTLGPINHFRDYVTYNFVSGKLAYNKTSRSYPHNEESHYEMSVDEFAKMSDDPKHVLFAEALKILTAEYHPQRR